MVKVLVSGAQAQVAAVAEALRERGVETTEVAHLEDLPGVVAAPTAGGYDSYVQLGVSFSVQGTTAIQRVHHLFAEGVLARFTALDTVLRSANRPSRVVLVMGQLPPELATPADVEARRALTAVLAGAAQADVAPSLLDIRILPASASPDEVARTAFGEAAPAAERWPADGLSHADWRVEILGLVEAQT